MTDIEKLEMAVGKKIEQWNISDLDKFSLEENLEALQLLKKPDVIMECLNRTKNNKDVLDVFIPLSIKSLLNQAEKESNSLLEKFSKKEITSDELLAKCKDIINDNKNEKQTVYRRVVSYLMIITIFPEVTLLDSEIQIKEDISEIKEIICALAEQDIYSCYTLIEDLLQVIIPLRQRYKIRNDIDILDDEDKRLEKVLDSIITLKMALTQSVEKMTEKSQDQKAEGDDNE